MRGAVPRQCGGSGWGPSVLPGWPWLRLQGQEQLCGVQGWSMDLVRGPPFCLSVRDSMSWKRPGLPRGGGAWANGGLEGSRRWGLLSCLQSREHRGDGPVWVGHWGRLCVAGTGLSHSGTGWQRGAGPVHGMAGAAEDRAEAMSHGRGPHGVWGEQDTAPCSHPAEPSAGSCSGCCFSGNWSWRAGQEFLGAGVCRSPAPCVSCVSYAPDICSACESCDQV